MILIYASKHFVLTWSPFCNTRGRAPVPRSSSMTLVVIASTAKAAVRGRCGRPDWLLGVSSAWLEASPSTERLIPVSGGFKRLTSKTNVWRRGGRQVDLPAATSSPHPYRCETTRPLFTHIFSISISSPHTLLGRSRDHRGTPVFSRACLLARVERFKGLRSGSVSLSHVWQGLAGGRFQSDSSSNCMVKPNSITLSC